MLISVDRERDLGYAPAIEVASWAAYPQRSMGTRRMGFVRDERIEQQIHSAAIDVDRKLHRLEIVSLRAGEDSHWDLGIQLTDIYRPAPVAQLAWPDESRCSRSDSRESRMPHR